MICALSRAIKLLYDAEVNPVQQAPTVKRQRVKKSNFHEIFVMCLSYVQLFSYNFKLCVFLFAPFGIHKMNTQISFPSVRFFLIRGAEKKSRSSCLSF